jgi:hypothetical protein
MACSQAHLRHVGFQAAVAQPSLSNTITHKNTPCEYHSERPAAQLWTRAGSTSTRSGDDTHTQDATETEDSEETFRGHFCSPANKACMKGIH